MDLKNRKEFLKLIADCRKNGVEFVKSGEFELKLSPNAHFPTSTYKQKKQNIESPMEMTDVFDEEAALFWSSAGLPDAKDTQ